MRILIFALLMMVTFGIVVLSYMFPMVFIGVVFFVLLAILCSMIIMGLWRLSEFITYHLKRGK